MKRGINKKNETAHPPPHNLAPGTIKFSILQKTGMNHLNLTTYFFDS